MNWPLMEIALMLLVGMFLSAFFSGSETGFYRATRVRLVLDSRAGDPIARGLLWLTNNPSLFVATTLVGNNLANYLMSLAIVLGTGLLLENSLIAELLAPVVLAPVFFVYGELLPKNLFFHAPNRLLRRAGPLLLFCTALFAPVSALLWVMSRCLRYLLGETPERVRLTLARTELAGVLKESHEAGVLGTAQQRLAQGLFAVAQEPVARFCTPVPRMVSVRPGTPKSDVLRLARRHQIAAIPVEEVEDRRRRLIGYVRVVDLRLDPGETSWEARPLLEIPHTETHIAAMIRMQSAGETLARVVDETGKTVGLIASRALVAPVLRGG